MIVYSLRKFHEAGYPMNDLDLGVVIFSLNMKRNYLFGVMCTIYINHKSLGNLTDQLSLNMRDCIRLDVQQDYDCDILYYPGEANLVANTFSGKSTSPLFEIFV